MLDDSMKSVGHERQRRKWAVFKIQGFVCKRFLPSPPPPPSFSSGNSLPLNPTEMLAMQATKSVLVRTL